MQQDIMRKISHEVDFRSFATREKRWWGHVITGSNWNHMADVKAELNLPKHVFIMDTSLREGEETPHVVYSLKDKLTIARALEEAGVHELDCGFIPANPVHMEFLKAVKANGIEMKTQAICRIDTKPFEIQETTKRIDAAIDTGADSVLLGLYTKIPGLNFSSEYADRITECIQHIKARGVFASFWFVPWYSTAPELLEEIYQAAIAGGADRLNTAGYGLLHPTAYKYFIKNYLKKIAGNKQVGLHCHNDFGLSLANYLAGIEAGAEVVDTSINAMGDKSGIAAFEEVVMALKILYGLDTGIKMEKLVELSKLVEQLSGQRVVPWKPIVGENYFVEGPDSHLYAIYSGRVSSPLDPETLGRTWEIIYGPSALGGDGLRAKIERMGLTATDEQLNKILDMMREKLKIKDGIPEEDVEKLIRKVL